MSQTSTTPIWDSGADLSECGRWRWRLWRVWDKQQPLVLWVMLNPSTADALQDDPTIKRCKAFSRRWGYGGIMVVNLFGYRSSHPSELRKAADPIGADNDEFLLAEARHCGLRVAAWGTGGDLHGRDRYVRGAIARLGRPLHHLGLTKDGFPKHPLARGRHRIADDQQPIPWATPHL